MNKLTGNKCEPCKAGAPLATDEEIGAFMQQLPEWSILQVNGVNCLTRSFTFKNFREALDFTNRVGTVAEAENHHPEITTGWGNVTVQWWTHKIGGLHRNDFIMAAKTDACLTGEP